MYHRNNSETQHRELIGKVFSAVDMKEIDNMNEEIDVLLKQFMGKESRDSEQKGLV